MANEPGNIDVKMLVKHMQGMEGRLIKRIDGVETKLGKRIDGLEDRIDRVAAGLTRQIDGIDERLDAIEIETLPERVVVLERHCGLATS